ADRTPTQEPMVELGGAHDGAPEHWRRTRLSVRVAGARPRDGEAIAFISDYETGGARPVSAA
ncbi:MAG TPA: hypothetical protein VJU82_17245, partial [Acidobacteriaceae bacterium]|nr:hypothetical protein [Acidobacteriaceae bacterium]